MKALLKAAATALILMSGNAAAQEYQYTLGGFSPGGLGSLLGVGIDQAVKDQFPGSNITYQPSGGGFANVALVDQGRVEFGLAHSAEVLTAVRGDKPFKTPIKGIMTLGLLYRWVPMQIVINKSVAEKYGISKFSDIITKKLPLNIVVNKPGNIVEALTEEMFVAAGASFDKFTGWGGKIVFSGSSGQVELLRDRRVDVMMNNLFVGSSDILEVSQALDVVMLPISEDIIAKVSKKFAAVPFVIPKNAYSFLDRDVPSMSLTMLLIVNKTMEKKVAYNLTKSIVEHVDRLKSVSKGMNALTPEILASETVTPYHPGALQYLAEAGIKAAAAPQ